MEDAAHMMERRDLSCPPVRKLVLAWDPDFTKVTPEEAARISEAEASGFVDETDVDWDHLDRMA